MSDSDNEDLGFNLLFGNVGPDGELDADYLDEDARKSLGQALKRTGGDELLAELPAADRSEGRGSAAPRAPDGRPMLDFYDEPTAPEDQEEVQENDPQQQPLPSAAAPGVPLQQPVAAQPPQLPVQLGAPLAPAPAPAVVAPAGQGGLMGLMMDDNYDQPAATTAPYRPQPVAHVAAAVPAAAAGFPAPPQQLAPPPVPVAAVVQEPPEVEARRMAEAAERAARAARQEELQFAYLDVDLNGEDIVQFSAVFNPAESYKFKDTLLEISGRKEDAYAQRAHAALQRAARILQNATLVEPDDKDEEELLRAEGLAHQLDPLKLARVEVVSDEEEEGHGTGRHHKRPESLADAHIRSGRAWDILAQRSKQSAPSAPGDAADDMDGSAADVTTAGASGLGAVGSVNELPVDVLDSSWVADIAWGRHAQPQKQQSSRETNNRAAGRRRTAGTGLGDSFSEEVEEDESEEEGAAARRGSHATSHATPFQLSSSISFGREAPLGTAAAGHEGPMGWQPKQQAVSKALATLHTHVHMLRLAPAQRSDVVGGQLGRRSTSNGQVLLDDLASPTGAGRSAAEQLGAEDGVAGQMQLQHVQGLVGQQAPEDLLNEGWEQDITWSAGGQQGKSGVRQKVLWDLNDPHMVFTSDAAAGLQTAAAVIHPNPPAPPAADKRARSTLQDSLPELAHLNISREAGQGAGRGVGDRVFAPARHSKPTQSLTGIPIFPGTPAGEEWHRPRAMFCPTALTPAEKPSQLVTNEWGEEELQVVVHNLRGKSTSMWVSPTAKLEEVQVQLLATARKSLGTKEEETAWLQELPQLVLFAPDGMRYLLVPGLQLAAQYISPTSNTLVAYYRQLHPLPSAGPCIVPAQGPGIPVRPPGAFKTMRTITGRDGHALLLEYLEERPLFVMQRGMGARLTTYYRKRNESDNRAQQLKEEFEACRRDHAALPLHSGDYSATSRRAWMIGTPQGLDPDDISPFYDLAPMPPGTEQFAVDTTCFRAPAAPQVPAASDFLLIRLPCGALQLREISGCVSVGQQHPMRPVWAPGSEEAKDFELQRLVAYAVRKIRRTEATKKQQQDTDADATSFNVSVNELAKPDMFGLYGLAVDDKRAQPPYVCIAEKLLKNHFMQVKTSPDRFYWDPQVPMPDEKVLSEKVTADMCAQYEALWAGIGWCDSMGINRAFLKFLYADRGKILDPGVRLRCALDHLPLDAVGRQAAVLMELAHEGLPWDLSDAYQSVLKDQKNVLLMVSGVGDPTGRGRGISFIREDVRRAGREEVAAIAARADGSIVGTDADLRKLGNHKAGEIMLHKFKQPADKVAALGRWQRIDFVRRAVRDPANTALVNSDPELLQYVRNIKINFADQQARMGEAATAVFNAQVESLQEVWEDVVVPDEITWESVAAAAQAAQNQQEAGGGAAGGGGGGGDSWEEGSLRNGLVQRPKPGRPGPAPGDIRIRRQISCPGPDGTVKQYTVFVTDREVVNVLRGSEAWTERTLPKPGAFGRRPQRGAREGPLLYPGPVNLYDPVAPVTQPAYEPQPYDDSAQLEVMDLTGTGSGALAAPAAPAGGARGFGRAPGGGGGARAAPRMPVGKKGAKLGKKSGVPKGVPKGRPGGGGGKRRRRGSDYDDDEFMSASDSEGDGDMDDDSDGGGARRTKRARGSAGAYEEALGGPATQAVMDLNTHLTPVIRALIAWQADTRNGISPQLVNVLLHQVNRKAVKDYHKFVPVAKQMYLTRIQNKVEQYKYTTVADFVADVEQLVTNARAYNKLGTGGEVATPAVIDIAEGVMAECQGWVQDPAWAAKAAELEAAIRAEQGMGAGQLEELAPVDDSWRHDPDSYQQELLAALGVCQLSGEDQTPPIGWVWVECERCQQWRLLTQGMCTELGISGEEGADSASFKCEDNRDRPGASCADPPDMQLVGG